MKFSMVIFSGFVLTQATSGAVPTFNRDIAPILYRNCAACHRPGEVAPFSLLTYSDAAKRAALIAAVTARHYMPPWKAQPGYGHFMDERFLTDGQIEVIGESGPEWAPEGDPQEKPAPPEFVSGWQAGKPDAVLTVPQPFQLAADGRDVFQCFVVPLGYATDKYVKTAEFHPGNARVVHHALFFLDTSGAARQLDAATPEPGYPCFGGPRIQIAGGLGGWAPGATPQPLPSGVAQTVAKGADLVVQIHYHPSGKPETDQSQIGLTFGDAPERGLAGMLAGTRQIDLAPGEVRKQVTDWVTVPEDVELIGIAPHAHLLCREMKVDAKLPGGQTKPLIRINDWDFNWQGQYRYAEPVRLPRGTRIEMTYTYDNSAGNPRNPSSPPKRVTFGEQTTDEMALLFLQVVLPHPEDVPRFRREFILGRIDRFLGEGGAPAGVNGRAMAMLRLAEQQFDANHDGRLDPAERQALLEFITSRPMNSPMKRTVILLMSVVALGGAQPSIGDGLGLGPKMKQNAEALRHYTYKRRTEVSVRGKSRGTRLEQVRYVDGKLEASSLDSQVRGARQGRGLRGRRVEKKKEEVKADIGRLTELFHSYASPDSDFMRSLLEKAVISRMGSGPDADLKVTANGVTRPTDSFTLIWSVANRRPVRAEIAAEVEGKPVRIAVDYAAAPGGPFYAARTAISAKERSHHNR